MQQIAQLKDAAQAAQHKRVEASGAIAAARQAQADVLEAILETFRPARGALSCQIQLSSDGEVEAEWHGIPLSCEPDDVGPAQEWTNQNEGKYEGSDLFYASAGEGLTLIEVTYSGHWSRWQGASCDWTATVRTLSAYEAVCEWPFLRRPDELVERLIGECQEAVARDQDVADTARGEAEKAKACLAAIKGAL